MSGVGVFWGGYYGWVNHSSLVKVCEIGAPIWVLQDIVVELCMNLSLYCGFTFALAYSALLEHHMSSIEVTKVHSVNESSPRSRISNLINHLAKNKGKKIT